MLDGTIRERMTQEIGRHDNHGLGTREGGLGKGNGPTPLIGCHFLFLGAFVLIRLHLF